MNINRSPQLTVLLVVCLFIGILIHLCACAAGDRFLEQALDKAGSNREELQKVLDHYKNNREDVLKYEAAVFLIGNMPGHYSYADDSILNFYKQVIPILDDTTLHRSVKLDTLNEISKQYFDLSRKFIEDTEIVDAEYLIRNIDTAFDLWRNNKWNENLTFDQFCEYLLPYKVVNLQPLENWRDSLGGRYRRVIEKLNGNDESRHSSFFAAVFTNQTLCENGEPFNVTQLGDYTGIRLLSSATIDKLPFGTCDDYSVLAVATMRSLGIPVIIESIPLMGRGTVGHTWFTLLNDNGRHLPCPWDITSYPGEVFMPYHTYPKIYRHTYAINRQREAFSKKVALHPNIDLFVKDVTQEYTTTSDISIELNKKTSDPLAYICTFNNHEWEVVDVGEIRNNTAHFNQMGRNVLYLVMGYDGRRQYPLSEPFLLDKSGGINVYSINESNRQTLTIRRKFPVNINVRDVELRLLGGKITASDRADFKDEQTVFTIDSLAFPDKIATGTTGKHRYWRYLSPDGSHGNISELQFFDDSRDDALQGRVIGKEGKEEWEKENVFDGDYLTAYDTEDPDGAWVGLDFGQPVRVDRIRCIPRTDDNYIHVGHLYELRYWSGDGWKSTPPVEATENFLQYHDMPTNTVYWLRCLTTGTQERIFAYENGRQVFW